jgi:hypothetical protein
VYLSAARAEFLVVMESFVGVTLKNGGRACGHSGKRINTPRIPNPMPRLPAKAKGARTEPFRKRSAQTSFAKLKRWQSRWEDVFIGDVDRVSDRDHRRDEPI